MSRPRAIRIGLLVIIMLSLSSLGRQRLREYDNSKQRRHELASQVAHLRDSLAKKQYYLKQMEEDPEFIERAIRRKLHYLRKDEIVLRFPVDDS